MKENFKYLLNWTLIVLMALMLNPIIPYAESCDSSRHDSTSKKYDKRAANVQTIGLLDRDEHYRYSDDSQKIYRQGNDSDNSQHSSPPVKSQ